MTVFEWIVVLLLAGIVTIGLVVLYALSQVIKGLSVMSRDQRLIRDEINRAGSYLNVIAEAYPPREVNKTRLDLYNALYGRKK